MNAATRAVIERLIEALEFSQDNAIECLNNAINSKASQASQDSYTGDIAVIDLRMAEARKLLEDDDWIRVEDALPVVPEGARYVEVWISHSRLGIERERWLGRSNRFDDDGATTHWRYAEQEPQPPKG